MRKLIYALCVTAACATAAKAEGEGARNDMLVTRTSADRYVDHASGALVETADCTLSARIMEARLERDWRGRAWLVFSDGAEDEGECRVRAVRPPRRDRTSLDGTRVAKR